jgi:hypothetical protein
MVERVLTSGVGPCNRHAVRGLDRDSRVDGHTIEFTLVDAGIDAPVCRAPPQTSPRICGGDVHI